MISLQRATREELEKFDILDRQEHASRFILRTGLKKHQQYFDDPNVTHLAIRNSHGELCGYFILVVETETNSVEFRRIIIAQDNLGVGQIAIKEMEAFCRREFGVKRIWLDVFEDNAIGRHIYPKMGYQWFKEELLEERKLLFFEKEL